MTKRRFLQLAITGVGSVFTATLCGCAAAPVGAKVITIILTWVGLIATTGYLVLRAEEQYWKVESAKLKVRQKELELEGVKNGKPLKGLKALNDQQLAAVVEHRHVRIEFIGGEVIELPVSIS